MPLPFSRPLQLPRPQLITPTHNSTPITARTTAIRLPPLILTPTATVTTPTLLSQNPIATITPIPKTTLTRTARRKITATAKTTLMLTTTATMHMQLTTL